MAIEIKEASVAPASPSQSLSASGAKAVEVTDALGRVIVLRKPPILAQYRLVEALGDAASNQAYMAMTIPLLFVGSIDGAPVPTPSKKAEVEALIQRLDETGITAVMEGVQNNFSDNDAASAEKKSDD